MDWGYRMGLGSKGFRIREKIVGKWCHRKPANGKKRRVGFFFSVDSDT
jgi:hypothetical protein